MPTSKTSPDGLDLQERDLAVLRGLFESRIMTSKHVTALYFSGSGEYAKKRLTKLKDAGRIAERRRHLNEPAILFLSTKAIKTLQERGALSEYPAFNSASLARRSHVGELAIQHELEVMDVKSAFHRALLQAGQFILAEFSTWPLLYQFKTSGPGLASAEILVKPDGFMRIHERERDGGLSEYTFFLEVDRSSKTQDRLITQAAAYFDYYRSGGFAVRNGGDPAAYKQFFFRLLMVCKSAERRNNAAEGLLQNNPPILTHTYLTTLAEVTTNPLGAIWILPVHYRKAMKETPFDPERTRDKWAYRRQTEREHLVEKTVSKVKLLERPPQG